MAVVIFLDDACTGVHLDVGCDIRYPFDQLGLVIMTRMTTSPPSVVLRRFIVVLVGCFSCTRIGAAADSGTNLYDASQWTLVKSATGNFGQALPNAKVELLKSVEQGGHDGAGEPLDRMNVIVSQENRIIYEFMPLAIPSEHDGRHEPSYYMDNLLELRDVTGDHVPEIIFHAGDRSASDFISEVHVLQYRQVVGRFVDIRGPGFSESKWDRFQWLDFHGRALAIVADPIDPEAADVGGKFHQYVVFGWNPKHQAFRVLFTIPSTHRVHPSGTNPLALEKEYIVEKLEAHHQHRR